LLLIDFAIEFDIDVSLTSRYWKSTTLNTLCCFNLFHDCFFWICYWIWYL